MHQDTADMAAKAFDVACGYYFAKAKDAFISRHARYFSDETDESILRKAGLVRDLRERGMSWAEATDMPDIALNAEDREYVSYLLYHWATNDDPPLTLADYRHNRLISHAADAVHRALTTGENR